MKITLREHMIAMYLACTASFLVSLFVPKNIHDYREAPNVFKEIDKDSNGKVDPNEAKAYLEKVAGSDKKLSPSEEAKYYRIRRMLMTRYDDLPFTGDYNYFEAAELLRKESASFGKSI